MFKKYAYTIKQTDNQQVRCRSVGFVRIIEKENIRICLHIPIIFRTFANQKKHRYYDTKNHTD